nr:immunoglobulin heavy chain junction region [Macaca mulatta]MOV49002.1 immunoglobulin heavy chain junction region [Macaca mulatta]MOV49012.1 immunoglobulin heavy chain junction region [Macaca mulatta]MOV49741.1 immunoglobulin heavy chain junction region [Macaca mulatta]MOV50180.1 immunoglobulin heavy chain junction region [Macaca mulatta]
CARRFYGKGLDYW